MLLTLVTNSNNLIILIAGDCHTFLLTRVSLENLIHEIYMTIFFSSPVGLRERERVIDNTKLAVFTHRFIVEDSCIIIF